MASAGHHEGWVYDQQGAQRCSSECEEISKCDRRKLGGAERVAGAGWLRAAQARTSPMVSTLYKP